MKYEKILFSFVLGKSVIYMIKGKNGVITLYGLIYRSIF